MGLSIWEGMDGIVASDALRHHPGTSSIETPAMPPILRLPDSISASPRQPVDRDRLVAGSPCQAVDNAYSSPDQAFHCGIWEGDVGAWRVRYTEHELCHMLAGRVRMTGDDGSDAVFSAGDSFVIPAGFEGLWEVLEPARKLYAVYEP
ncbi:MAG: cupin domain-containing protein [Xanthomonadaceae bacterium]|nr:cupin domain-containing protein [Xanthomonadaceae bacterium]